VAEQVDRMPWAQGIEQGVEVAQVVGKPVAVAAAAGRAAEAAPVRRHHVALRAVGPSQRVDDELERRAHVHPAVQHQQRRPVRG
jgi:hypothetical protein